MGLLMDSVDLPPIPPLERLRRSPDGKDVIIFDTGPLIRNVMSTANIGHGFCPPGVIAEIKDEDTRAKVKMYMPNLRTEAGDASDLKYVRDFAKLTGDASTLSAVDMDVAALAVKLTRQFMGAGTLRSTLPETCRVKARGGGNDDLVLDKNLLKRVEEKAKAKAKGDADATVTAEPKTPVVVKSDDEAQASQDDDLEGKEEQEMYSCEDHGDGGVEESYYDYESSDGEDVPWITQENIHHLGQKFAFDDEDEAAEKAEDSRTHGYCITTDFAVQNLLLSMGAKLKSVDGFNIKSIKVWGLLCRQCSNLIMNPSKKFCDKCGGYMLRRVGLDRGPNGEILVKDTRKHINLKGQNTSLPAPKQGKAGKFKDELILCEDQLLTSTMKWRLKKADNERQKILNNSTDPFAGLGVGTHSKSEQWETDFARIGLGKGNPNSKLYHRRNKGRRR